MDYPGIVLAVAGGICLSAAAGFRAFLPLFAVSLAAFTGFLPLNSGYEFLGSLPALIVFGTAVVFEVLADKFPVVDNLLDMLYLFVKPVAGAILLASSLYDLDPLSATVIGIVAGGGISLGLHAAKAKVRLLGNTFTAGLAAPVLSIIEEIVTLILVLVAVFVPILAVLFLIVLLYLLFSAKRKRGRTGPRSSSGAGLPV